ncbi:MAG: hypothetical protein AAB803_00800 [Patescibacteria group bacterium]
MKTNIICFLLLSFSLSLLLRSVAYADYLLPYPSYMPGNKLYRASKLLDRLGVYWHWGTIASFNYRLAMSDKYLVEAKTLFEYKQYLLAVDALRRSNEQFQMLSPLLTRVGNEGKEAGKLAERMVEASSVHRGVLERLKRELPAEFIWKPEKRESTTLDFATLLTEAMELRKL